MIIEDRKLRRVAFIDHLVIQLQVFADSFWKSIGWAAARAPPFGEATAPLQRADRRFSRDAVQLSALGWRNFPPPGKPETSP